MVACRPVAGLVQFKVGEEIYLQAAPDKAMALILVPIGHDDGLTRKAPAKATKAGGGKRAGAAARMIPLGSRPNHRRRRPRPGPLAVKRKPI